MLYIPHDTKIGHFRDIFHHQSLSMVLKKLNLMRQKQTCTTKTKRYYHTK